MDALQTHEIGSLSKLSWRVKAIQGRTLGAEDLTSAKNWGERLGIAYQGLIDLLQRAQQEKLSEADRAEVMRWSSRYAIKMLEQTGLDVIYDGEQQRSEMYHYPVSHSQGFEFRGTVRSFDNKYYRKAACVAEPKLSRPYHLDEFRFARDHAEKPLKVPITGAYTLADWSYDEYYSKGSFQIGSEFGRAQRNQARRRFVLDVARNLIRPNIETLVEAGAEWIQIDEPAVTTHPEEVPLFVEAFEASTQGIDCQFSAHICFSDYTRLFPDILSMENCSEFALEFANRDSTALGVNPQVRTGYEILTRFKEHRVDKRIGVGVVDVHSDFIEPPDLIRDRILYAVEVLGDPARVNPTPDCGLRTRTWDVAYEKLSNLVAGAEMAARSMS
ncbi:MAG: hypothetical protein ACE5JP_03405 [Candidatus Bipolaricaulia bacterium]